MSQTIFTLFVFDPYPSVASTVAAPPESVRGGENHFGEWSEQGGGTLWSTAETQPHGGRHIGMFNEEKPGASVAAAGVGALIEVAVVVVSAILFFQWAGGITPYDIVTLDQQSRLELEGLAIFYMQVVAVVLGAPSGCWVVLRKLRASGARATALLIIPWVSLLWTLVLRRIPSGPNDPLVLPYLMHSSARSRSGPHSLASPLC